MSVRRSCLVGAIVLFCSVLAGSPGWAQEAGEAAPDGAAKPERPARGRVRRGGVPGEAGREGWRGRRGARQAGFAGRGFERRITERVARGEALSEREEEWLGRYLADHLIRTDDLNAIESAHYSVAEIHLRRGDHTKCLDQLDTVIAEAGDRQDEAVWITRLNTANVCRRRLGDVQRAIREYKLVKGRWAGFAQRELLKTLEEMDKLDQAVKVLEEQYDAALEKGEKLALLRRIAEFHERNKEDEKAIAAYQRITKEFTAADIDEMKRAATETVRVNADNVVQLRKAGKHEEAEGLVRETQRRFETLRAQGRTDEARAMQAAMDQTRTKVAGWGPLPRERRER